jgi:oligopeptide transport system substrate-binding protein
LDDQIPLNVRAVLCCCYLLAATSWADYKSPPAQHYVGATERIRGFDPVTASDTTAITAISKVYQGLYEFEYLLRPYEIRPQLAEALPEISADRLTYTIRIKKGIHFADDPCFRGGKGRELVAEDFVYSWKRLADAHNRSTRYFSFEGKIVGLDDYRKKSTTQRVSGDEPLEGLKAIDRYTLQIRLVEPYPQLRYVLTQSESFAVPREAVEYYGEEFLNHPVGTGPFVLHDWKWRNYRIEFARNPNYHDDFYPTRGAPGDREKGLLDDAGKRLPLLDRVTQYVISEDSTAWLMFLNGQLGLSSVSRDNFDAVLTPARGLTPDMTARGIWMSKDPEMFTTYIGFNMDDPVVGKNKQLRQALSCAVNRDAWVRFFNERHIPAKGPIPPGVPGYDADRPPAHGFDLERARRLLAEAGYPGGVDPKTGKRLLLTIELPGASDPQQRQAVDLLASFFDKIGVELRLSYNNWPEFLKKIERRQAQMWQIGWIIPYPDALNFLLLFYSKNASPGPNDTNYNNPAFDKLFERARVMDDSPQRTELYRQMAALAMEDAPWICLSHPLAFELIQPWLKNYKHHDCPYPNAKYYRVDPAPMKH